jgi:hypothetical protein
MWRETKTVADAAKNSADAAISLERPYLLLAKMHLRERRDLPGEFSTYTCEYTIENYGKTPAVLVSSCVELRCLQGLPNTPPYKRLKPWRDKVIYQKEPIGDDELIVTLAEEDRQFLGEELTGYDLFLFGYFMFYDVFGKRRKTGFCYRLDRGLPAFWRIRIPAYHYDTEENG